MASHAGRATACGWPTSTCRPTTTHWHPTPRCCRRCTPWPTQSPRLREQGSTPFTSPYRFDDAGWVANRWCEILPISLAAKQRLMTLTEPQVRLKLVDEYLRSKGVV